MNSLPNIDDGYLYIEFFNTEERTKFMNTDSSQQQIVKVVANKEMEVLKKTFGTLHISEAKYKDELAEMKNVWQEMELNNPGLSFPDRRKVLESRIHDVFGKKLSNQAPDLQNEKELYLILTRCGGARNCIPPGCEGDKDIVMIAVAKDGWNLRFASKELRKDKEVVLAAVAQNSDAIGAASKTLRHDPEVIKTAAKHSGKSIEEIEDYVYHLEQPNTMSRLPVEERWVLPE